MIDTLDHTFLKLPASLENSVCCTAALGEGGGVRDGVPVADTALEVGIDAQALVAALL